MPVSLKGHRQRRQSSRSRVGSQPYAPKQRSRARSRQSAMAPVRRQPYLHPTPQPGSIALSVSLYEISIPTYRRGLQNLSSFLDKAEAHARTNGADLATYAEARLAPDMYPFPRQGQLASDAAKGGAARLAGIEAPAMPDTETSFPQLRERIAK